MECGSEATWQGSYLRFVDAAGRELESKDLVVRSLDSNQELIGNLTSKGCFVADKPGLWMLRHKEKLEAAIVKIEARHPSGIVQLQDVSRESMELECPRPELGSVFETDQFLSKQATSDLRGYQLQVQIRTRSTGETKTWPWLNLAYSKAAVVGGLVTEGEADVTVELKNYFRMGESAKKTCAVRFDFTAAQSFASVQKTVPRQYQSRPFYVLNAEDDLSFFSDEKDVAYHEVCVHQRLDWLKGQIEDEQSPVCESPQIVTVGGNLSFPERHGFWQVQYRSVDMAGNKAPWAPTFNLLMEQTSKIQAIKSKATYIATLVESKPIDGTANSIVSSLELHQLWKKLPTQYERDKLENLVLLSLHRPWLRDTIRQDLLFQSTNSERLIASVFVDDETKIVSFLQNIENLPTRFRELRYYDIKKGQWKKLAKIEFDRLGGYHWFNVSKDQKKFIFGFTPIGAVWVGRVVGDDIEVQEIKIEGSVEDYDSMVWFARLIDNDKTLIVTTTHEKLSFDMNDLTAPPLKESTVKPIEDDIISDDGKYVLIRDYAKGLLTWTPITDASLPDQVINLHDYFDANNVKHVDMLDSDRYLLIYASERAGPCVFAELKKNAEEQFELQRLSDNAPCLSSVMMAPDNRRGLMNDFMDSISTVVLNNLSNFSKRIPTPGRMRQSSDVIDYEIPDFFAQSKDSKLLAFEWYNREKRKFELVFLQRTNSGEYVESFLSSLDSGYSYYSLFLAEDLGLVGGFWNGSVSSRGYRDDTRYFHVEIDREDCGARSGAYLGNGRLALGCIFGSLKIYDISKPDMPIIDSIVPAKDGPPWVLLHDEINNLLIGGFGGLAGDLYVWPNADIHAEPKRREVFRSGIGIADLAKDGRHLAVGSAAREEMYLKVYNIHDMDAPPSVLEGHNSYISKLSFFGKNSLLVSASDKGILKIWDVDHPDFPGVTLPMQKGGEVYGLIGINGKNEFIVGNDWEEIYHFRLDTIDEIRARSCKFLTPYFQDNSPLSPEQKKICAN